MLNLNIIDESLANKMNKAQEKATEHDETEYHLNSKIIYTKCNKQNFKSRGSIFSIFTSSCPILCASSRSFLLNFRPKVE